MQGGSGFSKLSRPLSLLPRRTRWLDICIDNASPSLHLIGNRFAPLLSMRLATTTAKPYSSAAISETHPYSKRTALLPARSRPDRTPAHLIHVPVPRPVTPVDLPSLIPAATRRIRSTLVLATRPCPSRRLLAQPAMSVLLVRQNRSVLLPSVSARTMDLIVVRPLQPLATYKRILCTSAPTDSSQRLLRTVVLERARRTWLQELLRSVPWRVISALTCARARRPMFL